ncbi:MAG: polysaccharide biosynthesis/export family protein, partial [Verrucomicrobiae bacterium]|nr:polysaccharide biosynthesis/export family protein [Verrucomicrobiae bacterium]
MSNPGDSERNEDELSLRAVFDKRGESEAAPPTPAPQATPSTMDPTPLSEPVTSQEPLSSIAPPPKVKTDDDDEGGIPLPFDPMRLVLALIRVLPIAFVIGVAFGVGGYLFADMRFQPSYTAWSQIMKVEIRDMFRTLAVGESFKPKQLSLQTMVNLMVSRAIIDKVAGQMNPPLPPGELRSGLTITPERETELITIQYSSGRTPQDTVAVLNLFLREVVKMTKDFQTQEANEVHTYLARQLADLDAESKVIGDKILSFSRDEKIVDIEKEIGAYLGELTALNLQFETLRVDQETLDLKISSLEKELAKQNPMADQLRQAGKQLDDLLVQFTEENPIVISHREKIAKLEEALREEEKRRVSSELQPADTPIGQALYLDIVKFRSEKESLKVQLEKLTEYRAQLQERLARLPAKGVEYAKLKSREASLEQTRQLLAARNRETELFLENAPGLYRIGTAASIDDVATFSPMKNKIVVTLVAFVFGVGLICFFGVVIETLDERIKSATDLARVTGVPVVAKLPVLGRLSAGEQSSWAFRTWTQISGLLSRPDTHPVVIGFMSGEPGEGRSTWIGLLSTTATSRGNKAVTVTNETGDATYGPKLALGEALADPRSVSRQLATEAVARVRLAIPDGWRWDLAQRKAWHAALKIWHEIPGCLVFLELPPAVDSEAVLLAEQVTDLFWVSVPTKEKASVTADQIQMLRESRVNLVGALLNREVGLMQQFFGSRKKLRQLLGGLVLGLVVNPAGAATNAPPVNANLDGGVPKPAAEARISVSDRPQLAQWQQRLTLGPEDQINISMYQVPNSLRKEVEIGPDGTINYMHAQGVRAEGLTIDELREALREAMSTQYRNVRVIITPHQFRSKRVYLLGKVTAKGSYTLDRPLTIIEAVAQAFGLEIGLFQQNTVELADLNRSFLMRGGRKMDVDFYKLFMQGDLSQNILLEPDDYIYMASSIANDYFVLGEVRTPGKVGYVADATVITSIVQRGGFSERAFLKKILVVRGSMAKPETFVVDAEAILSGRQADFRV